MRYSVRPELTTASVVHGLFSDHGRRCWTTLHRDQPAPIALIYRGLSVQINRATSYGGMDVSMARMKALEEENRRRTHAYGRVILPQLSQ